MNDLLVLSGILIVVIGFLLRLNPLLVVTVAALATGFAAGLDPVAVISATDNVGLFFGEDIFIAIGSILLMKGFLEQYGIILEPLELSVWAIPTAIAAFLIHGARLMLLDRKLAKSPNLVRAERSRGAPAQTPFDYARDEREGGGQ